MNQWMYLFVVGSACLSGACATTQAPSPPSDRVVATTDEGLIRSAGERAFAPAKVSAKPADVVAALRDAYEELGIKVEILPPAGATGGQVGNRYFVKSYRLGKAPLSTYLDCGSTMTGPAADNYKITMSVVSTVSAEGEGSSVQTSVVAKADAAAGGNSLSCRSIGTLESAIHQALEQKLGG